MCCQESFGCLVNIIGYTKRNGGLKMMYEMVKREPKKN